MRLINDFSELNLESSPEVATSRIYRPLYQVGNLLTSLKDFIRKTIILIFNFSLTNTVSLTFIGAVNRLLGRPIRSLFFMYPPSQSKYAEKYGFKWVFKYSHRNPLIVGAYFQNFRMGLVLAAHVQEDYFKDNSEYLRMIKTKLERTRQLVGAEIIHFSGIFPSELNRVSLIDKEYFSERCDFVAEIVIDAERVVREQENIFEVCPILLLGGKGNIGSAMKEKFMADGREVYIIDRDEEFPEGLRDKRAILIDVSRKGVLESRIDQLWPNMILLNERYPEPNEEVVSILNNKGINVYHVAGVKAKAFPPFPYAYAGGIPCCAAIREDKATSLVKKL